MTIIGFRGRPGQADQARRMACGTLAAVNHRGAGIESRTALECRDADWCLDLSAGPGTAPVRLAYGTGIHTVRIRTGDWTAAATMHIVVAEIVHAWHTRGCAASVRDTGCWVAHERDFWDLVNRTRPVDPLTSPLQLTDYLAGYL